MRPKDVVVNTIGILVSIIAGIVGLKFGGTRESSIGIIILLGFFLFISNFF